MRCLEFVRRQEGRAKRRLVLYPPWLSSSYKGPTCLCVPEVKTRRAVPAEIVAPHAGLKARGGLREHIKTSSQQPTVSEDTIVADVRFVNLCLAAIPSDSVHL